MQMSEINETLETADTEAETVVPEDNISADTKLDTEAEEGVAEEEWVSREWFAA